MATPKRYYLKLYNSIDRSWRQLDTLPLTTREASGLARSYFKMIDDEGIFGEADQAFLVPSDNEWPSHKWKKSTQRWVVLK